MENISSKKVVSLRKITPIAIGYFSYGTTFGVLAKTSGFELIDVFFQSGLVYAGTAQFASLTFIDGSMLSIFITTFLINFRYLVINLSTLQKLKENGCNSTTKNVFTLLYNSDETFLLQQSYTKEDYQNDMTLKVNVSCALFWVMFTALGFLFSQIIPQEFNSSLAFAIPLIFLYFLKEHQRLAGFTKIVLSTIVLFLVMSPLLGLGFSILFSALLSSLIYSWMEIKAEHG